MMKSAQKEDGRVFDRSSDSLHLRGVGLSAVWNATKPNRQVAECCKVPSLWGVLRFGLQ